VKLDGGIVRPRSHARSRSGFLPAAGPAASRRLRPRPLARATSCVRVHSLRGLPQMTEPEGRASGFTVARDTRRHESDAWNLPAGGTTWRSGDTSLNTGHTRRGHVVAARAVASARRWEWLARVVGTAGGQIRAARRRCATLGFQGRVGGGACVGPQPGWGWPPAAAKRGSLLRRGRRPAQEPPRRRANLRKGHR